MTENELSNKIIALHLTSCWAAYEFQCRKIKDGIKRVVNNL
jgi:hypothetical protein